MFEAALVVNLDVGVNQLGQAQNVTTERFSICCSDIQTISMTPCHHLGKVCLACLDFFLSFA
jgi:hypothetical protein